MEETGRGTRVTGTSLERECRSVNTMTVLRREESRRKRISVDDGHTLLSLLFSMEGRHVHITMMIMTPTATARRVIPTTHIQIGRGNGLI